MKSDANTCENLHLLSSEDEYDISVYKEVYDEYEKSGKQSRPINELWKELDL